MPEEQYTAEELADHFGISKQQAIRYITRFGPGRRGLDTFLSSSSRCQRHRAEEIDLTSEEVSLGL